MDTATKTGIDAAKTASKRVAQKTAQIAADLIRNEIADKITSLGKKGKEDETNKRQQIYIPPEKRQQIIDDLRLIQTPYKNGIPKIINLLHATSDNVPRFIIKKWVKVYDQSRASYNTYKQVRFKTSMLRSDYVITVMHILLPKELLLLQSQIIVQMIRKQLLKIMQNLLAAFQKLLTHLLIRQNT